MRSLPYFRAGIGLAGRTPPQVYETADEARQALITALEELAEENPDDAVTIDRVLQHLNYDTEAVRFLDYFDVGNQEYVAYLGADTVEP